MQSKAKNTSISSKAAQRERAAQMAQQRAQQARLLLFIGAFAVLVAVIVVILIASRPADAPIPAEASTRYEGLTVGMTTDPKYPLAFPTIGDPNAPVKIEEISSFACPVCLRYHDDIFVNVLDKIKAGQVQYIYIPTTLTGDYTPAQTQAVTQAAYCAMQQNKFWQMNDILYLWQKTYGVSAADQARLGLFSVGDLLLLAGGMLVVATRLRRSYKVDNLPELRR